MSGFPLGFPSLAALVPLGQPQASGKLITGYEIQGQATRVKSVGSRSDTSGLALQGDLMWARLKSGGLLFWLQGRETNYVLKNKNNKLLQNQLDAEKAARALIKKGVATDLRPLDDKHIKSRPAGVTTPGTVLGSNSRPAERVDGGVTFFDDRTGKTYTVPLYKDDNWRLNGYFILDKKGKRIPIEALSPAAAKGRGRELIEKLLPQGRIDLSCGAQTHQARVVNQEKRWLPLANKTADDGARMFDAYEAAGLSTERAPAGTADFQRGWDKRRDVKNVAAGAAAVTLALSVAGAVPRPRTQGFTLVNPNGAVRTTWPSGKPDQRTVTLFQPSARAASSDGRGGAQSGTLAGPELLRREGGALAPRGSGSSPALPSVASGRSGSVSDLAVQPQLQQLPQQGSPAVARNNSASAPALTTVPKAGSQVLELHLEVLPLQLQLALNTLNTALAPAAPSAPAPEALSAAQNILAEHATQFKQAIGNAKLSPAQLNEVVRQLKQLGSEAYHTLAHWLQAEHPEAKPNISDQKVALKLAQQLLGNTASSTLIKNYAQALLDQAVASFLASGKQTSIRQALKELATRDEVTAHTRARILLPVLARYSARGDKELVPVLERVLQGRNEAGLRQLIPGEKGEPSEAVIQALISARALQLAGRKRENDEPYIDKLRVALSNELNKLNKLKVSESYLYDAQHKWLLDLKNSPLLQQMLRNIADRNMVTVTNTSQISMATQAPNPVKNNPQEITGSVFMPRGTDPSPAIRDIRTASKIGELNDRLNELGENPGYLAWLEHPETKALEEIESALARIYSTWAGLKPELMQEVFRAKLRRPGTQDELLSLWQSWANDSHLKQWQSSYEGLWALSQNLIRLGPVEGRAHANHSLDDFMKRDPKVIEALARAVNDVDHRILAGLGEKPIHKLMEDVLYRASLEEYYKNIPLRQAGKMKPGHIRKEFAPIAEAILRLRRAESDAAHGIAPDAMPTRIEFQALSQPRHGIPAQFFEPNGFSFNTSPYKRVFFIADIHGNVDLLNAELELIAAEIQNKGLRADDVLVVFSGDYIHKGHGSATAVDEVIGLQNNEIPGLKDVKVIALRGNHEELTDYMTYNNKHVPIELYAGKFADMMGKGLPETIISYFPKMSPFEQNYFRIALKAYPIKDGDTWRWGGLNARLRSQPPTEKDVENFYTEFRKRWIPFIERVGHLEFFKSLQIAHQLNNITFVHGGPPGTPEAWQQLSDGAALEPDLEHTMLWRRSPAQADILNTIRQVAGSDNIVVTGHTMGPAVARDPESHIGLVGADLGFGTNAKLSLGINEKGSLVVILTVRSDEGIKQYTVPLSALPRPGIQELPSRFSEKKKSNPTP